MWVGRTIYGEVTQRSRGGALYFDVWTFEEVKDGLKGRSVHRSDIYSPLDQSQASCLYPASRHYLFL